MFEFLGKLMGIAARSSHYMDIMVAPMVWKLIVGEDVTADDYLGIDATSSKNIQNFRKVKSEVEFNASYLDLELEFTVMSLGGKTVELHRNGRLEPVSWANLSQYCNELEAYRLSEMVLAAEAIRRGILTQLPPVMVSLIKWKDLEMMVCGEPTVNIDLLKSATEYSGYSVSDPLIIWFWEIMNEYSQNDRRAFLRFTWGRNRLPLTKAGFKQKMKISKVSRVDKMPESHTCFFRYFSLSFIK